MDIPQPREFAELTDANARDIMLHMLSAEPVEFDGYKVLSSHPIRVGSKVYTPCEIVEEREPYPKHIHREVVSLYHDNPERRGSFWAGADSVVGSVDELDASGQLGRYGLMALFESLTKIGMVKEETGSVPQKLREFVETEKFAGRSGMRWVQTWSGDNVIEEEIQNLHPTVYHAFIQLQRGLSVDYWLNKILRGGGADAKFAFRGLAYLNPGVAEELMPQLTAAIKPEDAGIHIRSARRARKRLQERE